MSTLANTYITPEEYLERERKAETKSEYLRGEIFAMAGASYWHGLIVSNLVADLAQQLRNRPCSVLATDMRLRVDSIGLYTYPDVMVICGPPLFADDRRDIVTNPVIIVEVLSESTKDYDRGEKFASYRTLASLKEYLTVAQDKMQVEQWTHQADQRWTLTEHRGPAARITLECIEIDLRLADIYEKIDFSAR